MIVKEVYVAEVLTKDQNVKMVNDINIASVLGLPLGPFIGYLVSLLNIYVKFKLMIHEQVLFQVN